MNSYNGIVTRTYWKTSRGTFTNFITIGLATGERDMQM